jgi:HTH-type transcriptional regulator/antitoxin HipB
MEQLMTTSTQAGRVFTARRKALKLSQEAVATKLGFSQNRLSELEADPSRLTLDRFITLAGLLGLELVIRDKSAAATQSEW